VAEAEVASIDGIAYRDAGPAERSGVLPALCLHGFPESSFMWRHVVATLADAGRRAVAPDLPGFGDSPPDPPGTWERQVEAVERFRLALGLERMALVVHDWGGLIGLRWACEHPGAVGALVLSNTGFFPDGKWSGMAKALRTEGDGEELLAAMTREGFGQMMGAISQGMDEATTKEYWKVFETDAGRQGILELYRSGDFKKLKPYEGTLAELNVPTLLLWGENDPFAPVAGAHRFKREIPQARLVVIEGAGHFVYADEPRRSATEVAEFLAASGV
jgi:haloalkane dehalogenase